MDLFRGIQHLQGKKPARFVVIKNQAGPGLVTLRDSSVSQNDGKSVGFLVVDYFHVATLSLSYPKYLPGNRFPMFQPFGQYLQAEESSAIDCLKPPLAVGRNAGHFQNLS